MSDQNYEPINANYPAAVGGSYTVRAGESLQSIAQSLWGDAQMWFLLADANDLSGAEALQAGQVLLVPNKVTNIHNNASTVRPYNPGEVVGNLSPTMPPPPKPASNALKIIVVVAVAVVATYMTAGAMAGVTTSLASGLTSIGVSTSIAGGLASAATGFVAGAVGSAASQGGAMAMGMQDEFERGAMWKSAAQSGLTYGFDGYIKGANEAAAQAAQAGQALESTTNSAVSWYSQASSWQQAAVRAGSVCAAQGLASGHFSWRQVAASAAGAGLGQSLNDGLSRLSQGVDWLQNDTSRFSLKLAASLSSGWAANAVAFDSTEKASNRAVLGNLFASTVGNMLGQGVVDNQQAREAADRAKYQVNANYSLTSDSSSGLKLGPGGGDGLRFGFGNALGDQGSSGFDDPAQPLDGGGDLPAANTPLPIDPRTGRPSFRSAVPVRAADPFAETSGSPTLDLGDPAPNLFSEFSLPSLPYLNYGNQVTSNPVVNLFRGMSNAEFFANMGERSGGVEYFSGKGNAGNLYLTPDLDYTRQLDAKSPAGKYSNYVRFDVDKAAYDAIAAEAYVENWAAQKEHPGNKPYVADRVNDPLKYRNKFTVKGETGGVINLGVGEYKTGQFNQGVVSTTVVRNYNANMTEGTTTKGPGYDPTRFAPEGALRLQSVLNNAGKAVTLYAVGNDAVKVVSAVQSGDSSRIGETVSGVAGGWSGAWAGAKVGAEWGFKLERLTANPYVIVGATFVGGLVGGGLGYAGGENLGQRFHYDFLRRK